jgi:oxygen-independent coproporphyrinogen-3 oxidase
LPAYEISNHARPGAECRHNLAYWRYQDYVGIGPGAHGRLTMGEVKYATRQARLPERWLAAVEKGGTGIEEMVPIDRDSAVEEMLMMGLRLTEGVSRARLEDTAGRSLEILFGDKLAPLVEGGFLALDSDRLAATAAGRQRLNAVLSALLC